jgi:ribosomal protein L34
MQRLTKHKKIKGIRKHGFLARMKTHGGQKTIKRRRDQGRKELAVSL